MFRGSPACLLALCTACTFDFDAAGPRAEGGSASVGGGIQGGFGEGGTPVSDCGNGGECVPLPPGFDGVVVLNVGCGASAKVFDGYSDFAFKPATCGCNCVPASDECAAAGAGSGYSKALCDSQYEVAEFSVTAGCVQLPAAPQILSVQLDAPAEPPGCVSDDLGPVLPPLEWSEPVEGCSFQSLGCNGGDICLPDAGTRYCFYRANDGPAMPCPVGLTDTRVLQASDVEDSRDCSCDCGGTLTNGCAPPQWALYSDTACATSVGVTQSLCGDLDEDIGSVKVSVAAQVTCEQGPTASGTVTVSPKIQACCSP